MNRTLFYEEAVVDDVKEIDFLYHNLSEFVMKYEPNYLRLAEFSIMRPDLISQRVYGTVRYWWIICSINNVQNPLEDLKVGMILKIPNRLDILDFYKQYRKR
jgi:hypothetical protein